MTIAQQSQQQGQLDPREALIEQVTAEIDSMKAKLDEIRVQIEQAQVIVDRAEANNREIATELHHIEEQIDTVPRADIKNKYNEALEARFRLLTMRGQLERLQVAYDHLQTEQELLVQIHRKLQGVTSLDVVDGQREGVSRGNVNVVRMIQAQEEERERVARQMHDGPAQSLTNFILQTEICQKLFDRNPARAAEELDNLKTAASVTFQKVRDFIFDLRPMMLTDLGIVPTVRRYVDSFKEKNDIEVRLDITGEERRLEPHREVMIFRAVQELMVHARDYASASKLTIKLDMSGSRINAVVEDDGRGFDPEMMDPENVQDARTQGLITLKERFELVRGTVAVFSAEGEGTNVRIELPVSDDVG